MTSAGRPTGAALTALWVAALIVTAEALAMLTLAGLDIADLSTKRLGTGIGVGLLLAAYGLGQIWAAWSVVRGASWARSPLIVTQLIQLLIAWNLRSEHPVPALMLMVAALVVLSCLLSPPVTRALSDETPV